MYNLIISQTGLTLLICSWAVFSLCTSGVSTRNRSPRPLLSSKSFLYFTWRSQESREIHFCTKQKTQGTQKPFWYQKRRTVHILKTWKHYKLYSWSHTDSADLCHKHTNFFCRVPLLLNLIPSLICPGICIWFGNKSFTKWNKQLVHTWCCNPYIKSFWIVLKVIKILYMFMLVR